jgi:hypothetical protein
MHDSLNLMNASSAFISPSADRAGKLRPLMQISLPQVASMLFAYSPFQRYAIYSLYSVYSIFMAVSLFIDTDWLKKGQALV